MKKENQKIETKSYWKTSPTRQFKEIVSTLEDSKINGKTSMIIGGTGLGKSKTIDTFCRSNPEHTYRITVSSLYKLADIVMELADLLGVENAALKGQRIGAYSLKLRVDRIVNRLIEIKENGGNPIIIFDEGENLEIAVLKMIKGLYDALKDYCSIVLIGTDQLMNKLLNLRKRNRDAIPQLYRRFKAGLKILSPIDKQLDFQPFFDLHRLPKGLQGLLLSICDNYGELHDYLEPALKYADKVNKQLTEDMFRVMYNMPKFQ